MNITNDLPNRWNRLQEAIGAGNADGCLLTANMNLYYATGHVFVGYCYIPATGDPLLFVRRPNDLTGERIESIYKPEQMPELFKKYGLKLPKKLLLEADELSYNEYVRLQNVFQPKETGNATTLLRQVRSIKTPYEIEQLRHSAEAHAAVYRAIPSLYRRGMTDLELQFAIEGVMREKGSIGLFRAFGSNMEIYMGSLLAGDNAGKPSPYDFALGGGGSESLPIGANGSILQEGDAVMVDMAGNFTPYITDMTRTFAVGKLPEQAYRAHRVALDIQSEMEETARPGTPCAELYNLAVRRVEEGGLADCFMGKQQQAKFVGHGIGLQINELPVLMARSGELLQPGMVFAYEPKFIIGGVGAVGIENSYLVTDDGVEKLTLCEESILTFE